jgi:hypothetical protein
MDIIQRGDFRKNIPLNSGDVVYVARNILGDIRNIVRSFGPFLQMAQLPSNFYDSTSIPRIKSFPFEREPAPSVEQIIRTPQYPPGAATWQGGAAK